MNLKFIKKITEKNSSLLVNILKISIFILMAIALLGFFNPFYEYPNNAKIYGYQSMVMANGNYEYENKRQDKLREIKLLDPSYVSQVVSDYQSLMKSNR